MKRIITILTLISCFLFLGSKQANAQIITTVAGNGTGAYSGDGGAATAAEINYPTGVALDAMGNLYISDYGNSCIRKVTTAGIISTIAGNGTAAYSGDGAAAIAAELFRPNGIAFDVAGNLYIADCFNNRIRKVTTSGIISTIVGNGVQSYSGNGGPATAAELNHPSQVAIDAAGNIYLADQNNNVIRKVNTAGIINTIIGNGTGAYAGDAGQATAAEISYSNGVALDAAGNVYVADQGNNRVRKVNSSDIINTIVGTGVAGFSGDGGQATAAELYNPTCVRFGCDGSLYIADYGNNRIRKVTASGIISTIAGNGIGAFSGDGGQGTAAEINTPIGIDLDAAGNLYIADSDNNRIRKIKVITVEAGGCEEAGIEQVTGVNNQITIYPNPSKDVLNVECLMVNEKTTIVITDMIGNTVKQMPFTTQHLACNITDLSEGVYNILIQNSEVKINKKVVIVR